MAKVKKVVKKVLENTNIINTGEPAPTPPPAPQEATLPPPLLIKFPELQEQAAPPTTSMLQQIRKDKIAKADAGNAGRAATILARRQRSRRSQTTDGGLEGGGGSVSPTYINDVLGK